MASTSQASFVARLAKAEQLYQSLINFNNYDPGETSLKPEILLDLINQLHLNQTEHTNAQHEYLLATFERRKLFIVEPNSIGKLLSPIGSFVRAKMNKNSQQAKDVTQLIIKIRGAKTKAISKNADTTTISSYEKSYGSQLQNFQDIITLLISFGTNYEPSNTAIKITQLQATYQDALAKTNAVTQKLTQYKPKIVNRQQSFELLTQKANAIKEMVKSQYGISSTEYILIKGLSFN